MASILSVAQKARYVLHGGVEEVWESSIGFGLSTPCRLRSCTSSANHFGDSIWIAFEFRSFLETGLRWAAASCCTTSTTSPEFPASSCSCKSLRVLSPPSLPVGMVRPQFLCINRQVLSRRFSAERVPKGSEVPLAELNRPKSISPSHGG